MKRIALFIITCIALNNVSAQEKILNTLKERVRLMGYAQLGYTYDEVQEADNTFDIKRIIFMAEGKITNEWSCFFMYNFNGGGNLLEMYTDYKVLPWLSARVGQFKTAYTIESPLAPTSVELINCYSQATNYLAGVDNSDPLYGPTTGRDIGAMVFGSLLNKRLSYNLAIMNGQGINMKDRNSNKDLVGGVSASPVKWLALSASFVKGKGCAVGTSAVNPDIRVGDSYTRNRWAIGATVETKPVSLRSEYLGGKDGTVKSDGFYVMSSFHVMPKFDIIASYDYLNKNKDLSNKQTNYIAGVQYWFYPYCRLQAQYTYRDSHIQGESSLVQAQIQIAF